MAAQLVELEEVRVDRVAFEEAPAAVDKADLDKADLDKVDLGKVAGKVDVADPVLGADSAEDEVVVLLEALAQLVADVGREGIPAAQAGIKEVVEGKVVEVGVPILIFH